mmetsp:Transcript_20461/g.29616  ORF Transcript_20461/g.29616 Transcript_20461/m.29616 type:complete len:268 (-) Transcript_20461:393-1196(-)
MYKNKLFFLLFPLYLRLSSVAFDFDKAFSRLSTLLCCDASVAFNLDASARLLCACFSKSVVACSVVAASAFFWKPAAWVSAAAIFLRVAARSFPVDFRSADRASLFFLASASFSALALFFWARAACFAWFFFLSTSACLAAAFLAAFCLASSLALSAFFFSSALIFAAASFAFFFSASCFWTSFWAFIRAIALTFWSARSWAAFSLASLVFAMISLPSLLSSSLACAIVLVSSSRRACFSPTDFWVASTWLVILACTSLACLSSYSA